MAADRCAVRFKFALQWTVFRHVIMTFTGFLFLQPSFLSVVPFLYVIVSQPFLKLTTLSQK